MWDIPYLQGKNIGSDTVAALAVGVHAVKNAVNIPVGVECHMNGADHALACAVASSAKWVRVFEWCNAFISQSGYIEAIGGKLARDRSRLHAGEIAFLCDVNSKITLLDYFVRRSMISLLLLTNLVIWSTESGWLESIARS